MKKYGVSHLASEEQQSVDVFRANYSERPDPSTLSSLALLRIRLITQSLGSPSVQSEIGEIVSRDIADERTEFGGKIELSGTNIHFLPTFSYSESNGAYSHIENKRVNSGIATFHLHALHADTHKYAGPSGWI